jgi:hypothetical protein
VTHTKTETETVKETMYTDTRVCVDTRILFYLFIVLEKKLGNYRLGFKVSISEVIIFQYII